MEKELEDLTQEKVESDMITIEKVLIYFIYYLNKSKESLY